MEQKCKQSLGREEEVKMIGGIRILQWRPWKYERCRERSQMRWVGEVEIENKKEK